MGGAISSVAGGNRSRLLSRSVGRRSQTVEKRGNASSVA